MMDRSPLKASDLYVMLERAFRRESRNCGECTFSLPYAVASAGDWSVIPATSCSDACRMVLEDLVARYRQMYTLNEALR